jgi:TonB family protein
MHTPANDARPLSLREVTLLLNSARVRIRGYPRSMQIGRKSRIIFWSIASAAFAGCAGPEFITEHPVENDIPPLKTGVYALNAVDVRPVATREFEPDYPYGMASILTGKAVVVFTVHADGKVGDTSVVEADDVQFGEAAVSAILKWRFHPAQVKGAPVDCRMTMPFVFVSPYGNYSRDESIPDPSNSPPQEGPHQATMDPTH